MKYGNRKENKNNHKKGKTSNQESSIRPKGFIGCPSIVK